MAKPKIVHYINQFYAGIGGEEKADTKVSVHEGAMGPGLAFQTALGDTAEIVATVVCGDSYFNENVEEATKEIIGHIKSYSPDLVVAGPAFNAGRYGVACGSVCRSVTEELNIPAITGMYKENPGVDMYKKYAYIVEVGKSAAVMRKAVASMTNLIEKVLAGKETDPVTDGYYVRGRKNFMDTERGATRAVNMLVKKLKGEEFRTEFPMPEFDNVEPSPAIKDLTKVKLALVTSGGIVPKGNPDHIESSSASKYGKYSIAGVQDLDGDHYETAHGGYDPHFANTDADRVLPVDVLRDLEKEGIIGELHDYFYTTVGNGTSVANAKKYADEIAKELVADGVEGVILTST